MFCLENQESFDEDLHGKLTQIIKIDFLIYIFEFPNRCEMKKILLPTDFSESAWNAIAYALQLFKNETCTFYVLNTYEYAISRRSSRSLTDSQKGSVFQAQNENSESDLSDTVNKIHKEFKNTKHTFKTSSMNASFTDGLEKSIEKFKIDMIVMATTGTNLVKEMTFGSSFTALVGTINCPILAIPFDVDYKPLKEIGIACDYEFLYTKKLLKPLIEIADSAKILCSRFARFE